MLFTLLRFAVVASASFAIIALVVLVVKTAAFGRRLFYARPEGKASQGILYAFGRGMLPWEKESAAKHLPTFAAGIAFHLGIFAATFLLIAKVAVLSLPNGITLLLQAILVVGLACGLGLLIKRFSLVYMRAISSPDDYLSNLLVSLFLTLGIGVTFLASLIPFFFAAAIFLFVYMPIGKIRHCFFFFYSRFLFGSFFGRRGVLPHPRQQR